MQEMYDWKEGNPAMDGCYIVKTESGLLARDIYISEKGGWQNYKDKVSKYILSSYVNYD